MSAPWARRARYSPGTRERPRRGRPVRARRTRRGSAMARRSTPASCCSSRTRARQPLSVRGRRGVPARRWSSACPASAAARRRAGSSLCSTVSPRADPGTGVVSKVRVASSVSRSRRRAWRSAASLAARWRPRRSASTGLVSPTSPSVRARFRSAVSTAAGFRRAGRLGVAAGVAGRRRRHGQDRGEHRGVDVAAVSCTSVARFAVVICGGGIAGVDCCVCASWSATRSR
jgi:hypothetical protein